MTPAKWYIFSGWALILLSNGTWGAYNTTSLSRKGANGRPVLFSPIIITPAVLIWTGAGMLFTIASLFAWDRRMVAPSAFLDLLAGLPLYLASRRILSLLNTNRGQLRAEKRQNEELFLLGLVINGITGFAAFNVIGVFVKLATILTSFTSQLQIQQASSTVGLSLLLTATLVYTILDDAVNAKTTRFVVSPYIALVLYTTAALTKNWEADTAPFVLTAVTLGTSVLGFALKLVSSVTERGVVCLMAGKTGVSRGGDAEKCEPVLVA